MFRRVLTVLVTALLVLPASAGAATRWVVKGGGWGHGIGMSQYGAFGMAQQGSDYREILTHYYTGTDIERADTQTIRVLLQQGRPRVVFTGVSQAAEKRLTPTKTYVARPSGAGVELRDNKGKKVGLFPAPLAVNSDDGFRLGGTSINGVTDGTYHGTIELRPGGGGLTVVNALSLDSYVQGVVPGEMPSSFHPEALKAQAVAARSYALTTDKGGAVFDQFPDTRSQVYRGVSAETSKTNTAVRDTAGQVVKYDGKVAVTYFFSTSGGHTENVENVFYGAAPAPYLRGVDDPGDAIAPRHGWTFTFTNAAISAKLRGYLGGGKLKAIKVRQRGVSPRIVAADVVSTKGSRRVTGTNLRQSLGTYDNWMTFKRVTTAATQATSVRRSGLAALVFGGGRGIVGVVDPAKPGSKLIVERRDRRGRWHRAEVAKAGDHGRYRIALNRPGTYRVKSGGAAGPAVRVR